jgi:hypothetical protein
MFDSLATTTVRWQSMDREYALDLYGRRLESALARGDDGLDGLDQAVGLLRDSSRPTFAFVFIACGGYAYFIWLDRDLSEVIAYWRGVDARHPAQDVDQYGSP